MQERILYRYTLKNKYESFHENVLGQSYRVENNIFFILDDDESEKSFTDIVEWNRTPCDKDFPPQPIFV